MKRIKKVIAFALMMVMMMAMSVTAFAADTTTITVKNLSANEATKVSIYKIAEIGSGKWNFSPWVKDDMYKVNGEKYDFEFAKMADAVANETPDQTLTTTVGTTSLTFTDVKAGAYLVLAAGEKTTYNVMGVATYKYDDNGKFVAKPAEVIAKSTGTVVVKDTDDTFVAAGDTVTFTITTEVPYIEEGATDKSFTLYENPTNLKNLTVTSVKLADAEKKAGNTYNLVESTTAKYELNLSDLVADNNDNAGKKVVVTITAVVDGVNGYENTAWSNKSDSNVDYKTNTVKGFTGSITIQKIDATTKKALAGAKFSFVKNDETLKFVATEKAGVYTFDKNGSLTELEVAEDGTLKVQGLSEGDYNFFETQAPEGYTINPKIYSVPLEPNYAETTRLSVKEATAHVNYGADDPVDVPDTRLTTLPFTGGMGTTIFTVLGVALMAIAAAVYFATKKTAKN